jgi:hypothetical protein
MTLPGTRPRGALARQPGGASSSAAEPNAPASADPTMGTAADCHSRNGRSACGSRGSASWAAFQVAAIRRFGL